MTNSLVKIENLSKSYHLEYGNVHVLKQIDLTIHAGESLSIMGPSGSGKSTLLNLLGCLDKPSSGEYYLNNQNVSHLNDDQLSFLRASKIGFIFQSFNLIPQMNVFENVAVPFLYQKTQLNEQEIGLRVTLALEKVHMQHRIYHLPTQLSGGEIQRVAIARALVINPLLILADEPTGNLDSDTGALILKIFLELNQQGSTLVIVTHDEKIGTCCERTIHMQDGRIVKDHNRY